MLFDNIIKAGEWLLERRGAHFLLYSADCLGIKQTACEERMRHLQMRSLAKAAKLAPKAMETASQALTRPILPAEAGL